MKADLIRKYQAEFMHHIAKNGLADSVFMYEAQSHWQSHWDIEEIDFHTMYDNALTSTKSGRLWGGSKNSAKESMLAMISTQKEFIRSAFRDLFSHEKDLGLRTDRFLFYCDESFRVAKDSKLVMHHHDRVISSVYLALESPLMYTLYDYPLFYTMMQKLGSRNIPTEHELDRYQKSMRAIHTLMSKNESWVSTLSGAIGETYIANSLLVMIDFAAFVANTKE